MTNKEKYQSILKSNNLRVTPQRISILETFMSLNSHPSAEELSIHIKEKHPNISLATVYNTLESFVNKGILSRVKTDRGSMLYDAVTKNHHHIYDTNNSKIHDYHDKELDQLLKRYFKNKEIDGLAIKEISLQILGTYNNK